LETGVRPKEYILCRDAIAPLSIEVWGYTAEKLNYVKISVFCVFYKNETDDTISFIHSSGWQLRPPAQRRRHCFESGGSNSGQWGTKYCLDC